MERVKAIGRSPRQVQQRARQLRRSLTPAESVLWHRLRQRKTGGLKFRRQQPIGRFVVDFYCHKRHLIVEVDGPSHDGCESQDMLRRDLLQGAGFDVISFTNEEVLCDLDTVLERIVEAAERREGGAF